MGITSTPYMIIRPLGNVTCDGWCHMVGFSQRDWFQLRFQAMVQTKLASKARRFSSLSHTYLSTATPHSFLLSFKFSRHRKLLIFEPRSIALFLPSQKLREAIFWEI